jgi:hypothetical protein
MYIHWENGVLACIAARSRPQSVDTTEGHHRVCASKWSNASEEDEIMSETV